MSDSVTIASGNINFTGITKTITKEKWLLGVKKP